MNRNIKKCILVFISFLTVVFCSSCSTLLNSAENNDGFDIHDNSVEAYKYWQEENESLMYDITECFENNDSESLKKMFLSGYATAYNLDVQIEKAFELYESKGEFVKTENLNAGERGRHTVDGKNILLEGSCEVDVVFDSGEKLELYFLVVNIDDESSQGIGLRYIYLSDSDTGEIYRIIGEYEEHRSDKGE
ncbi:MAG: DUF5104 domain-containing protein [Oscillospiraceae bacterium]|nr:DUF5104 domain-containing protein [Oscillospiraceae bacterium]